MKTKKDPRHIGRIKTMQDLFAWSFNNEVFMEDAKAKEITKSLEEIDGWIEKAAPMWPTKKINKLDLAILRMAVFELMVEKKNPPKVIVDESVELAKEYGSEASPGFINGALGKLITDQKLL